MTEQLGLRIRGLSKRYGSIVAVDDLAFDVAPGALVGFLGPNGAGKTTSMRSIVGLVTADSGTIEWRNQPVTSGHRRSFGYMPQERGLYPKMKVREQLVFLARIAGIEEADAAVRTDAWLERLNLTDRGSSPVSELSGGNQQRVQLAAALVHDPELLILDEPFAGLDPVAATTMRDIVTERAERGAAVLFSSHQLDLVSKLCDDVIIISAGRELASGSIADLRAASPRRLLSIRWADPTGGAPLGQWTPQGAKLIEADSTSTTVEVDAGADAGALIADAARHAPIAEAAFAPPELDQLFSDLVAAP